LLEGRGKCGSGESGTVLGENVEMDVEAEFWLPE